MNLFNINTPIYFMESVIPFVDYYCTFHQKRKKSSQMSLLESHISIQNHISIQLLYFFYLFFFKIKLMMCTIHAHCRGYYRVLQESNIFIGSKYSRVVPFDFKSKCEWSHLDLLKQSKLQCTWKQWVKKL